MKIDDKGIKPIETKKTSRIRRGKKYDQREGAAGHVTGKKDIASLSGQAKLLAKVQTGLLEVSDVREGQVEALKQSIADGSYQVQVEKLASLLMKHIDFTS